MAAKFKGALIAVLLLTVATTAAAPWHWRYSVLRSEHFEFVFREDQRDLARHYILAAEQAHAAVFPLFKEGPHKTIVLLQDDTDQANGSADFLPYPHITIYPVLPGVFDSIDDFENWAYEMMVHEYAHILNMYPAHGFYRPLSYLFGSVVRPNAVLPRWYLEGLAVDLETLLSRGGRLRASETHASARALVLENKLRQEDISRINQSNIASWPYGNRPYLFGGWWFETVQREKGSEPIYTWNQNFSRRLPFLLTGPMREQTGRSAADLLGSTYDRLETEARKQLAVLRSAPVTAARPLAGEDSETGEQIVFALSPSANRLAHWTTAPKKGGSLVRLRVRTQTGQDFSTLPDRTLLKTSGTLQARWLGEDRLLFDQIDNTAPYVNYRELYIYDLSTGRLTQLTHGARVQEAAPSPSGLEAACIQNDGGKNHLALVDLRTGTLKRLVDGDFGKRFSGPEFLNEQEIVFSVRESGRERLHVFNREKRSLNIWNEQLGSAQALRKISGGFLVTDASTGVRNVYWLRDGHPRAATNTLTDIASADFDPQRQELLISELSARGRRLRFASAREENTPPALQFAPWPKPPGLSPAQVSAREESYIPLAYMWPRYWIPFIYQVENGLLLQGQTASGDPAGRNEYGLLGSYDTVTRKGSYGINYLNRSLPTDIGAAYSDYHTYLGASGATVQSQFAAVDFSQNWPFADRSAKWSLGGRWVSTETTYRRIGPSVDFRYSRLRHPQNRGFGYEVGANHTEYLKQDGYLGYGQSSLHWASNANLYADHWLWFQARGSFAPRLPFQLSPLLGEPSVGGNYLINLVNSRFLLRGYPSAAFIGRKVLNANLEYVFPPFRLERGWGTFPWFLQNLEVALFTDSIAVDGVAFDRGRSLYVRRNLSQFYMGSGAELRLSSTAGYHLPLSFTLGLYYGHERRFGGGFAPFLGIGFGSLEGLQDKTP